MNVEISPKMLMEMILKVEQVATRLENLSKHMEERLNGTEDRQKRMGERIGKIEERVTVLEQKPATAALSLAKKVGLIALGVFVTAFCSFIVLLISKLMGGSL